MSVLDILGGKKFTEGMLSCAKCCTEVVGEEKAPVVTFERAASMLEKFRGRFSRAKNGVHDAWEVESTFFIWKLGVIKRETVILKGKHC